MKFFTLLYMQIHLLLLKFFISLKCNSIGYASGSGAVAYLVVFEHWLRGAIGVMTLYAAGFIAILTLVLKVIEFIDIIKRRRKNDRESK